MEMIDFWQKDFSEDRTGLWNVREKVYQVKKEAYFILIGTAGSLIQVG